MNSKLFALLVSFVFLAGVSYQSHAEGWYVGGGGQTVSFGDDLESIDNGIGGLFSGGYDFNSHLGVELMSGVSFHDDGITFNGYATHSYVLTGGKLSLSNGAFDPYLVAGLSLHVVDFEFFEEISGSGIYFGFGADIALSDQSKLNISFRRSNWDGEDSVFDYDVKTSMVTVAYNYYFSP